MTTYCDVNTCEDCPRYGDDCDGDKRVEHTDLISRADAIEAVASITMSIHLSEVICDKLLALPSADAVQGWIPCTERLPEKDDLVLVTVWNDVTIAWRNIYGGWESAEDMYEKGDVIAWMPLPKPYKGGDDE